MLVTCKVFQLRLQVPSRAQPKKKGSSRVPDMITTQVSGKAKVAKGLNLISIK